MISGKRENGKTKKLEMTESEKIYSSWSDYAGKMQERLTGEPKKVIKELKDQFDVLKELQNKKDLAEYDATKKLWDLKENLNNIISSLDKDESKEAIELKEELHSVNNNLKLINTTKGLEPTDVKQIDKLYDKYSRELPQKVQLKFELMKEQSEELTKAENNALKAGNQIKKVLADINEPISIVKDKNRLQLHKFGRKGKELQEFVNKVDTYIHNNFDICCHNQEVTNRARIITNLFKKKVKSLNAGRAIWLERSRGEKNTIEPELEKNKEYLAKANNALLVYGTKTAKMLREYQTLENFGTLEAKESIIGGITSGKEISLNYERKNYGDKRLPLNEHLKPAKPKAQSLNATGEIVSSTTGHSIATKTHSEPERC